MQILAKQPAGRDTAIPCGFQELGKADAPLRWLVMPPPGTLPGLALRHHEYHLEPMAASLAHGGIAVGLDDDFYVVKGPDVFCHIRLPARFYAIIAERPTHVVVQHEIGFAAINYKCELVWAWVGDLIRSWHLDGDTLRFVTWEGQTIQREI